MSPVGNCDTDVEAGSGRRRRRRQRRQRHSVAVSSETTTDGSLCFSGSDDQSWHSPLYSTAGGSGDEAWLSEIESTSNPHSQRESSGSDYLSEDVDLEGGDLEMAVHSAKEERDCRICHLNLVGDNGNQECGIAIELGCSCKGDLGAAHKHCAETWFKIKGNTTCEICGATALNLVGEQRNEANNASTTAAATAASAPVILGETRNFWHGRRIMNFLLACMVFAFVISWLFHFNVLS